MKKICKTLIFLVFCLCLAALPVFGQAKIGINGAVEWDKMEINATISLDLASAGIKLPSGRTQGEMLISYEYLKLIRPNILNIQVDSSSKIADLVEHGEWTLKDVETLALNANAVPPALSQDLSRLSAFYTIGIAGISSAFIRHERIAEMPRTLNPVQSQAYTGIIIIAYENLPVHGRKGSDFLKPCLFPKIWDTEMNLIFEKNMLNPRAGAMARYFSGESIFANRPSGLSPEIAAVVGERPLKIFAHGVFGIDPTDPIISHEDALLIISTAENRSLLREGRLAIILDNSVIKSSIEN
jgi:hypothetical protein